MLSNQILHKTVQDIKRITGLDCAVWDMQGICLVMTCEKMIKFEEKALRFGRGQRGCRNSWKRKRDIFSYQMRTNRCTFLELWDRLLTLR